MQSRAMGSTATLATAPFLALALLAPELGAQDAAPAPQVRIELRENPTVDLVFHVRALALGGTAPAIEALALAVSAARALDGDLGGSLLAWAPLDGLLPGCASAADVKAAFALVPETLSIGGTVAELRKGAVAFAEALVQAESASSTVWEKNFVRITDARARYAASVGPKEPELLRFHLASLGMEFEALVVPVYLVAKMPAPGAVTVRGPRSSGGAGVCFVGVDELPGSQLFETVLHEATHAFDLAAGSATVLGELRERLLAAGIGESDRLLRDVPHTLMFVQSAESIRRKINAAHQDYGERSGVYARLGPWVEALRGNWVDHLDGKLTREAALDEIVGAVVGPAK
jgi:hypothetical protein